MESPASALKKFIVGVIVGIASAIPGISGAILAVCFGIYERLVEDVAHLRQKIRQEFSFLVLIGTGLVFGLAIAAFGLDFILDNCRVASMLFFLGLIIGQLPELWNLTEPDTKPSKWNAVALVIGVIVMGSFLFMGESQYRIVDHDMTSVFYMILIGLIFSISKLAPGISGATVLLAMGLYQPLIDVIVSFDFVLMIPLLIGIFLGLIGFAKIVDYALKQHRKSTYMTIFGLTIGSIMVVIQEVIESYVNVTDLGIGVVVFFIGIVLSLWLFKIGKNSSKEFASQ